MQSRYMQSMGFDALAQAVSLRVAHLVRLFHNGTQSKFEADISQRHRNLTLLIDCQTFVSKKFVAKRKFKHLLPPKPSADT